MLHVSFMFLAMLLQDPKSFPPQITVGDPKGIASLDALHETLEALNQKSGPCVKGGGAVQACICAHQPELARLRAAYQSVIKGHPDWKDQQLVYPTVSKEGRPGSVTMSLTSYRIQLERMTCS